MIITVVYGHYSKYSAMCSSIILNIFSQIQYYSRILFQISTGYSGIYNSTDAYISLNQICSVNGQSRSNTIQINLSTDASGSLENICSINAEFIQMNVKTDLFGIFLVYSIQLYTAQSLLLLCLKHCSVPHISQLLVRPHGSLAWQPSWKMPYSFRSNFTHLPA